MKKRPFILMEVMIAISLLSLCAIPLVSFPLKKLYEDKQFLFRLELERQAEVFFYDTLLELTDISWEDYNPPHKIPPRKKTIRVPGLKAKELHYSGRVSYGNAQQHPTLRMQKYELYLDAKPILKKKDPHDNTYTFSIFAKKVTKKSSAL